jgi:hypothetical protein
VRGHQITVGDDPFDRILIFGFFAKNGSRKLIVASRPVAAMALFGVSGQPARAATAINNVEYKCMEIPYVNQMPAMFADVFWVATLVQATPPQCDPR